VRHAENDPLSLNEPLSDAEIDELQAFLMSDATSDETMMMDTLDGFLTALIVGPATIMPSRWFPRIWGPADDDAPEFESMEQAQRVTMLIMRHMNGIVGSMEGDPDEFDPMFVTRMYQGRQYVDGEMWCHGFMDGIQLCHADWRPLLAAAEGVELLRPIRLLASKHATSEEERLTETPSQREALTSQVPAAVAAIYRYWLPFRREARDRGSIPVRHGRKVGRNEPCPCGSGRKYKHCCGAPGRAH
jgi:uncharacterized protein